MSSPDDSSGTGGGQLDLTIEPPSPNSLVQLGEQPWNEARERERIRARLATWLVLLVAILAGGSYTLIAVGMLTTDELQSLNPIFAALSTLAGTAVGFYFGGGGSGSRP